MINRMLVNPRSRIIKSLLERMIKKLLCYFSRKLLGCDLSFLATVLPLWWAEYNVKKCKIEVNFAGSLATDKLFFPPCALNMCEQTPWHYSSRNLNSAIALHGTKTNKKRRLYRFHLSLLDIRCFDRNLSWEKVSPEMFAKTSLKRQVLCPNGTMYFSSLYTVENVLGFK